MCAKAFARFRYVENLSQRCERVRNVNAVAARMEDFQLSVTKTEQDEAGDVIGKSVGGCSAAPPKGSFEQAEQHFLDAA